MKSAQQIQERRQDIVQEMLSLVSMKHGTLNEQFLRVPQKGTKEPALRGPYYVLSRKVQGKTISTRIPAGEVEAVRQNIAHYNRFLELSQEFVDITEQLGCLEQARDTVKKTPKSLSSSRRKSRA